MRPGESAVAVGLHQLNAEYDPESQGGIPESAGTTGAGEDQPRPASLAFSRRLSGEVLLIDHDGWLLARKLPGEGSGNWSESDILCRAPAAMKNTAEEKKGNGLDNLIAAMDAETVRFVKGGFVHTTQ